MPQKMKKIKSRLSEEKNSETEFSQGISKKRFIQDGFTVVEKEETE